MKRPLCGPFTAGRGFLSKNFSSLRGLLSSCLSIMSCRLTLTWGWHCSGDACTAFDQRHLHLLHADGELRWMEVEDTHTLQVLLVWLEEDATVTVKGWD